MKRKSIKEIIAVAVAGYAIKQISKHFQDRSRKSRNVNDLLMEADADENRRSEEYSALKSVAQKKWAQLVLKADNMIKQP